jgi:hypothetical protein
MIRTCMYVIAISLAMAGCTDTAKKPGDDLAQENEMLGTKDFRNATWGMSKVEVKSTEEDKPSDEIDSAMIYSRQILGMNALTGYLFAEDKLVRAKYMFHQQRGSTNDYIDDYNNLKKVLLKKYGKAKSDKTTWIKDVYKNSPADWGYALDHGYVTYLSYWETKNTRITLSLQGENYKINLWLEYKSRALAGLEQKASEKKRIKGL